MLQITKNGNSIIVKGIDNKQYPDNGTLTIPVNNLIVVVDESNIATFRSASNNDVLFSGVIDDITIDGAAVTKDTIGEKFGTLANASTGGEGGEYTAGNGIKIEEKVISISDTLSTEISDKADKADVTAIETKVDTNTANIATKANASDVYTKTEVDTKITEVEGKIPDVSVYETKEDAAATYQVKGDYALKSDIPTVPTKVSELENDAKYITKADIPEVDLSNYYKKSETYSKEEVDTQLATKVEMSVLDNYYDKTEADAKYATQETVDNLIDELGTNTIINIGDTINKNDMFEMVALSKGETAALKVNGKDNDESTSGAKWYTIIYNVDSHYSVDIRDTTYWEVYDKNMNKVSSATNITSGEKLYLKYIGTYSQTVFGVTKFIRYSLLNNLQSEIDKKANKTDVEELSTKVTTNTTNIETLQTTVDTKANSDDVYTKDNTYSKEEVDTQLATKVEMSVLDNYYDKTEADAKYATQEVVNEEIAARIKADGEINTTLLTKADKTEIPTVPTNVSAFTNDANYITIADVPEVDLSPYAKTADVDTKLANKVDNTTYTTDKAALEADIATKANTSDVYTKTESDEKYLAKTDAATTYAEKATTLSGYGITDAYTQEEVDEKLKNVGGDEELDYGTAYALNDVEAKIYRVYDQVKPLENKITQLKTKITSLEESLTALDNKLNDYEEVIERRMATILNDLNSKIK